MIGLELSQQSERRTPGTVRPARPGPPRPPRFRRSCRQVLDGASPYPVNHGPPTRNHVMAARVLGGPQ
eukprot:566951-Hanusia_phi.AAC.1